MPPATSQASVDDVAAPPNSGNLFATDTEKLAELRYLIILTARWESADDLNVERRARFRADLDRLHREYFAKIDEIAMNCSVQQAMDAQKMVERTVSVPRCESPSMEPQRDDHGWF